MAKDKTVNEFLDDTVRVYGFTPLSDLRRRELRFKLALADIRDRVSHEDTSLALDLVLAEMQPKTGTVRTASSSFGRHSPCPRCNTVMGSVKLSTMADAHYCATCHITVTK